MMQPKAKVYSAPERCVVIPRNDWYVFFDPLNFSFTRVNEHGKAILEAVGSESTPREVAARVAPRFNLEVADIEGKVAAFLENMTATRFVHEGRYLPETAEPPDLENCRPGSLYLHPTFKCNLSCLYCYNKKERIEAPAPELSTDEWFSVLDEAREFGIRDVIFTGGEPLLRKDIFELAARANSLGMSSQLLTNALLVDERNIDHILSTFGSVGFSIDSHTAEKNDALRGKGAFDATVKAMRILRDRDFIFNAKAVITTHNVKDLPDLYQFFLEEFGRGSLIPNLFIPPTREMADLVPPLEDYLAAMERVSEVVERFYGDDKLSILRFYGIPNRQYQCGAGAGEISMGPDGSVYPCQALQKEEFLAGNVREQRLGQIYRDSPVLRKLRACTVDAIEVCRDCDVKHLCGGGCRSLAYNMFGEIDCHNSYSCEYLKNLAYTILWNCSCVPIEDLKKLEREEKEKRSSAQRAEMPRG